MSTFSNVSPLPIPETVKHKTDNLDWENMPSEACDLNYPVPLTVTWKDHIHIVAGCLLASAILPPVAALFGTLVAGMLMNWYWGVGAALLGICMFAYHHRGRLQGANEGCPPLLSWTSFGFLLGPAFLWIAAILTGRLNEPIGAFLYYVLIATPMVFVLSDLIATHAVYWLSAGLCLDHDALLSWRDDWDRRFLDDPTLSPAFSDLQEKRNSASHEAACRARHNYLLNVFWIFGAILVPGLSLMVMVQEPRRETIGLQLLCGLILGLIFAAWIRLQGHWRMVPHLKNIFGGCPERS